MTVARDPAPITELEVAAYRVPTEGPESDGVLEPRDGLLRFDPDRPGLGLDFRATDTEHYRVA